MEETIPEDVLKAARDYWADATMAAMPGGVISTIDLIARAIMAERERCARTAERDGSSHSATTSQQTAEWHARVNSEVRAADRIATSIRSGV